MKRVIVFHPLVVAIFPILSFIPYCLQMPLRSIAPSPWQVALPALIALVFVLALWVLFFLFLRDWSKAALLASLAAFLFLLHGVIYLSLQPLLPAIQSWHLVLADTLVLALCAYLLHRSRLQMRSIDLLVNVIAIFLLVVPLFQIGLYTFSQVRRPASTVPAAFGGAAAAGRPDVYYLIVDGYARDDILQEIYGYDNSAFQSYLREKGFYVARDGRTNYGQTYLSLASSLNMAYLDDLGATEVKSTNPVRQSGVIGHSVVLEFFRQQGYRVVAFASGYYGTEIEEADLFLAAPGHLSEFQSVLLNLTPLPTTLEQIQYNSHRGDIAFILNNLSSIPRGEEPLFVFAHIVAPHPPFVFGPHGEAIQPSWPYGLLDGSHFMLQGTREEYQAGYRDQLTYINGELVRNIDAILANSPEPPVIILQADHGPGSMLDWESADRSYMAERMSILNALYLPGVSQDELYPSLTPVNTFRIVLNLYFGTRLERLPDHSFFSTPLDPYRFVRVLDP